MATNNRKLIQGKIKEYAGPIGFRPDTLPFGDYYFAEDTNQLFKYNYQEQPIEIGSGASAEAETIYSTDSNIVGESRVVTLNDLLDAGRSLTLLGIGNTGKESSVGIYSDEVLIKSNLNGQVGLEVTNTIDNTTFTASSGVQVTSSDVKLLHEIGDGVGGTISEISIKANNAGLLICDSINMKGIEYDQDYSANYTDRSLTDMGFYFSVQGGVNNYIYYDPVLDRVVATRSLQTTLSSLYLGEVHSMSSGAENIFFRNNDSNINWFPMWAGILDQSIPANRNIESTIAPSGRVYTEAFNAVEEYGIIAASGSVSFDHTNTLTSEVSMSVFEFMSAQTVLSTDTLYFEVFAGTDDTGLKMYEATVKGISLTDGDLYEWTLEHPIELHPGATFFRRLQISSQGSEVRSGFLVRPSDANENIGWVKTWTFEFENKDLAFKSDRDHGFFDYNDLATATTPISILGGNSANLTNDAAGAFTNKLYPPDGITDVWDVNTQLFDFTELTLGSRVHYRLDIDLTISGANAEIEGHIELGIGNFTYELNVFRQYFKGAGTYNVTVSNFVYMGDTNTLTGGGRFHVHSSNNVDVKVNGWVCYITEY